MNDVINITTDKMTKENLLSMVDTYIESARTAHEGYINEIEEFTFLMLVAKKATAMAEKFKTRAIDNFEQTHGKEATIFGAKVSYQNGRKGYDYPDYINEQLKAIKQLQEVSKNLAQTGKSEMIEPETGEYHKAAVITFTKPSLKIEF
jgi:hypothetical protein